MWLRRQDDRTLIVPWHDFVLVKTLRWRVSKVHSRHEILERLFELVDRYRPSGRRRDDGEEERESDDGETRESHLWMCARGFGGVDREVNERARDDD